MLRQIINFIFPHGPYHYDQLTEGVWADQYQEASLRDQILQNYQQRWARPETPLSHPERYDPLNPPPGWRYDPYYETWMEFTQ